MKDLLFASNQWFNFLRLHNLVNSTEDYKDQFPNPYFDVQYYAEIVGCDAFEALEHFIEIGQVQKIAPCKSLAQSIVNNLHSIESDSWYLDFLQTSHHFKLIEFGQLSDFQKVYEIFKSGLFDSKWYLERYLDIKNANLNPLLHFINNGIKEHRKPNEFFDYKYVANGLNLHNKQNAFIEYIKLADYSINISPKFDSKKYLEVYPDVKASTNNPVSHFLNFGRNEKRIYFSVSDGSDTFLGEWYMMVNEDLRDSEVNAQEHYDLHGEAEGRKPNPYFNPSWYAEKYKVPQKGALKHFETEGWKQGYWPSQNFDPDGYISLNKIQMNLNPLEHYLKLGKKRGLKLPAIKPVNVESKQKTIDVTPDAKIITNLGFRSFIDNDIVDLAPKNKSYFRNALNIHWVIPDFNAGGGGHMSIFRTIRWLEIFGHKNTIWVRNPSPNKTEIESYDNILNYFQQVLAKVHFVDERFYKASGDVIFATDWGSVSYVNSVANFKRRFYFVQDYEPEFYAMGAQKLLAESTYHHDIDCICASPWLSKKMNDEYGLWAKPFYLAVNRDTYYPYKAKTANSGIFKIAFYARSFTERRCVELGWLALEKLAMLDVEFEVHSFGAPLDFTESPFKIIDHGVVSPEVLAEIFNSCDLGMVFSGTNYSLTPQEMMACELPVAELDGESTRAIFPEGVVEFLSPLPNKMAEQLRSLIESPVKLEKLKVAASKWVSQFEWEESARIVEQAIVFRLDELGFEKESTEITESVKASIIIPTYNGGEAFEKVLPMVMSQKTPWNYEVVIVDSGSKDGTLDLIAQYPEIKLFNIDSKNFQHGRTRNYAIEQTSGEFIAVLTHDALPATEYWLYDLVSLLEKYPNAAGAFGRHFAYPGADPYTKRDLKNHFKGFDNYPVVVNRFLDEDKYENNQGWRQFLHFYSDNNSCMRRSVWDKFPYPEVNFGEDQAWADLIIKEGYEKVYSKAAAVYHSHDFDPEETEIRAFEESQFFFDYFGYRIIDKSNIEQLIDSMQTDAQAYGESENLPSEVVELQLKRIEARIKGFARAIID